MKVAMLILGVIGSLIALVGGLFTIVGGFGVTALGALATSGAIANSGTFVFWSGVLSFLVGGMTLIASVVGGVAKKRHVIQIFSFITLMGGVIGIYLYNWFSGGLVSLAGILGFIGAREVESSGVSCKSSPLFYLSLIMMAGLLFVAIVLKNGAMLIARGAKAHAASDVTASAAVASQVSTVSDLPFVGARTFNFDGGNATEWSIAIDAGGKTVVKYHGAAGPTIEYDGMFANPLRLIDGSGLLIKGNMIYSLNHNGAIDKDCMGDGSDCSSELYGGDNVDPDFQSIARSTVSIKSVDQSKINFDSYCGWTDKNEQTVMVSIGDNPQGVVANLNGVVRLSLTHGLPLTEQMPSRYEWSDGKEFTMQFDNIDSTGVGTLTLRRNGQMMDQVSMVQMRCAN